MVGLVQVFVRKRREVEEVKQVVKTQERIVMQILRRHFQMVSQLVVVLNC